MTYYGVTFVSGKWVVIDAYSDDHAELKARTEHPGEDVAEIVYLTVTKEC